MNKKYILVLFVFSLLIFSGCEDLDTEPEGNLVSPAQKEEVISKDPSKAAAGVNGIFAQFSQYEPNYTTFGDVGRHNDFGYPAVMLFTDSNGNDVISEDNGYNYTGNNLNYTDRDYTSYECQIVWNEMYSIIYTTNNVIGSISEDTEDATSQFYLAQGLGTRAFCYWVLAQLYQFNYVGHESDACVPVITNENSEEAASSGLARSTVQEVYNFINSDLDKAISLLSSAEKSKDAVIRSDKRYLSLAVAYGLRARVNLTMQNWSEAASDASKAIEASSATPASISDVSKPAFWTVNESNWMWGIIIAESDDVVSSGIVNWISHMGSLNYGYANYSKGRQINKALYETIPSTDVRKGWWLDENKSSPNLTDDQADFMAKKNYGAYTQVKFAPYNNVVGSSVNANDIPLMRIEEMYLIKAEAEAKSGGDGKTTLENFVKAYRDPEYVCEAADVQKEVFRQRRIELWGEGLNWFDIMRLNTGVDRRGGGYPNATMVFNIKAGSDILLWRISEAEVQANPALNESDNNPSVSAPEPVADL
jgi:hypothetical protein